jgi:hypothetical protein
MIGSRVVAYQKHGSEKSQGPPSTKGVKARIISWFEVQWARGEGIANEMLACMHGLGEDGIRQTYLCESCGFLFIGDRRREEPWRKVGGIRDVTIPSRL